MDHGDGSVVLLERHSVQAAREVVKTETILRVLRHACIRIVFVW